MLVESVRELFVVAQAKWDRAERTLRIRVEAEEGRIAAVPKTRYKEPLRLEGLVLVA